MERSGDLLALAALLEQAYRLALVIQDDLLAKASVPRSAIELIDLLDDARVLLLRASCPSQAADLLHLNRSTNGR